MINVLLIGDSIRMHYLEATKEKLGSEYNVYGPEENCKFSSYTLNTLRFWLDEFPKPDIIHWNNGLWDTAIINNEDCCFADIGTYISNLKRILKVLKSTGAKVIFATTTPVNPEKEHLDTPPLPNHRNSDIIRYNKKAVELMNSENIPVNDLFSIVYPNISEYISDDLIHPTPQGVTALSDAVSAFIKSV